MHVSSAQDRMQGSFNPLPILCAMALPKHALLVCLPAALLQACVSVGNPAAVDEVLVSRLQPLRSTKQDMVRSMGQPTYPEITTGPALATGKIVEVWTYDYTHVDISPLTLIPLVGPFLGSSTVTSGSVVARFDATGIVQNVSRAPYFDPRLGYEGFDFQLTLY